MNPSSQVFVLQLGFLVVMFMLGRKILRMPAPPKYLWWGVVSCLAGSWVCFLFIMYLKYVVGT